MSDEIIAHIPAQPTPEDMARDPQWDYTQISVFSAQSHSVMEEEMCDLADSYLRRACYAEYEATVAKRQLAIDVEVGLKQAAMAGRLSRLLVECRDYVARELRKRIEEELSRE